MSENQEPNGEANLAGQIEAHLRAVRSPRERRTIAGLLRALSHLPLDHARAAVETSAAIAAISLRASIEFLRVASDAAHVLEAAELRAWGEIGRRLTMAEVEAGVNFFAAGVGDFATVPSGVRISTCSSNIAGDYQPSRSCGRLMGGSGVVCGLCHSSLLNLRMQKLHTTPDPIRG